MQTVAPHRPSFCPHPLALLAACFAAGVLLARALQVSISTSVVIAASASALAAVAFLRRKHGLASSLVCAAFALAGLSLASAERNEVARDRVRRLFEEGKIVAGEPVELTGVVARAPEATPDGFFVELKTERVRVKGREADASGAVELFAPVRDSGAFARYDALELRRGARVRVLTALERAEEFRNPGANSRAEFLGRRGFDAAGAIKSPLLVERLDDETIFLPLAWLDGWRARLHERLTETFSLEAAGVLQAAMLGNRYGLSRASAERFREGGTFHVLVISGLHISFLGGLALWLAGRLTRRRAPQFAAAVAPLWAYAVAVGAGASVLRAALMFTLVALAPVVRRPAGSLNALGGAALALLVCRPSDLFDPSFQLTFLSVLAIVTLGWALLDRLREVGSWRPTRSTPHPPDCPRWFRALGEALHWSGREWERESERDVHSCRLFKTGWAARLERWRAQRPIRYAFSAVVVSACVQVVMLPPLVLYFHRLSPAALVLNVFVGALMAAASIGALVAAALDAFNLPLAAPLARAVESAVWLMAHGVDPLARAGVASVRLPEYAGWRAALYALYYPPLAALLVSLARWRPLDARPGGSGAPRARRLLRARRLAWLASATAALLVVAHPLSAPRADGRLRVDFLDVGQGDAALLTMPDGATLLVDAGGRARFGDRPRSGAPADSSEPARFDRDARSVGEFVVSEYLWHRGLSRVDYLLATHAHADHMDGLKDVARNFRVRAALVARAPGRDPTYADFASVVGRAGVPLRLVARGDVLRFGAVTVEVLWPARVTDDESPVAANLAALSSGNDDSIVLRVGYGSRCFLLAGDIEQGAEAALASAVPEDLRCDVVKVAHHGSRTSSTAQFVSAARPSYAVVSVGADSPYGHPAPEVLRRWRAAGAEVLQTGRRGAVTFSTDGRDLRLETFVPE